MKLEILEEAAAEIRRHHRWYQERNPRVAARLADLFEAIAVQIALKPDQFPLMEISGNPGNLRRARMKGFPLYVLYRVTQDRAQIVAVPHTSQETGYWQSRLVE